MFVHVYVHVHVFVFIFARKVVISKVLVTHVVVCCQLRTIYAILVRIRTYI